MPVRLLRIPDNAIRITDRSEAPEGATIVEGERGGLAYLPKGEEPEEASWFDDTDFEEEFGSEVAGGLQVGQSYEVAGQVKTIEDATTQNGQEYFQTADGTVLAEIDGVVTGVTERSAVFRGDVGYINWSPDAGMEDGWYDVGTDITKQGDALNVDFTDADGVTHAVDAEAVEFESLIETQHRPVEVDALEPDNQGMEDSYDDSYPDNPQPPANLNIDSISDNISEQTQQQLQRGLSKAAESGFADSVTGITELDPDMNAVLTDTLARFDPETKTIAINTDSMNQETLDTLGDNFAVGDSVEDLIVHETIHARHAEALIADDYSVEQMREELLRGDLPPKEQELMKEQVSDYAASNPLEVVAEVGTKISLGEPVSDEVLQIYNKYGGPDL